MFAKLADTVMKHSKAIIAIWVVIFICCVPFMLKADSVLEYELTKMTGSDSESAQGNAYMDANFSNAVDMDEVLVIKYDSSDSTQTSNVTVLANKIGELLGTKYNSKVSITDVGSYKGDADNIAVEIFSVKTTDTSIKFSDETGNIRNIVSQAKTDSGVSLTTYVTGNAALTYDTMTAANSDVSKIHVLSIALIFILLVLFFGALVTAVVPPLGFGVAYGVAMVGLYFFASSTSVFYLTSTLMVVTMLGAGCDYGIFIITRYREELKNGAAHHDALSTAIQWAGESVFTSGLSVIIGFACLAICDFQMVRNMGLMLALGIVFALVAALTFVPAIVNLLGEKTFWPNSIAKYKAAEDGTHSSAYGKASHVFHRYFQWVARVTRNHAKPIVIAAIIISVPSIYVYATSHSSYDMIAVEPDGEAKEGLYAIMDETYGGTLMPTYVVVQFPDSAVDKDKTTTLTLSDTSYGQFNTMVKGIYSNQVRTNVYQQAIDSGASESDANTAADAYMTAHAAEIDAAATQYANANTPKALPYLTWSAHGLTASGTTFTGYVPAVMTIANDIKTKNTDIVAQDSSGVNGLTSWAVLYYSQGVPAATQKLIAGYTDGVRATAYSTAYSTAIGGGATEEQAKAIAEEQAKTYMEANKDTIASDANTYATAHINDASVVNQINSGIVELMPSAVKGYVEKYVAIGAAYAAATSQTAVPSLSINVTDTDGNPATIQLANLIDYVLNAGTGLISNDGTAASLMIVTNEKPMSDKTMDFQGALQNAFHGKGGYDETYSSAISKSQVCGTNAVMYDISGTVTNQFNYIQIIVVILLLIMLFLILGSYVTPIRAILCIILSVTWTLALTFLVFQEFLAIPVCWIVPIVLFVVLLGLGLDYEIFVTTRVRENRIRGMSNDDAIDAAITSASGTISLCALIMGGTFCTLLIGSSSMLQEFGFALGIGIFIDGLFMVTYVGPALMHLLGDWSWKGPAFLQRKHKEE